MIPRERCSSPSSKEHTTIMDPVIILPAGALLLAWAATRKKKPVKKAEPVAPPLEEPKPLPPKQPPSPPPRPALPPVGPGGEEPWRPGGPGPVGPMPFPGPNGGPKDPEEQDPSPVEIWPDTQPEEIDSHPNAAFGLFVSSDCKTVFEGVSWYTEVFLPRARQLVLQHPLAFHHPVAVLYELLVAAPSGHGLLGPDPITQRDHVPDQAALQCIAAWGEFGYGDFTPLGTYSGWISSRTDPHDEFWSYAEWFSEEYLELSELLSTLYTALWAESDLAAVFDQNWPADEPPGDLDFDA